ncbi:hypothetical protein MRX96_026305 [Rhipicephalus microplus]
MVASVGENKGGAVAAWIGLASLPGVRSHADSGGGVGWLTFAVHAYPWKKKEASDSSLKPNGHSPASSCIVSGVRCVSRRRRRYRGGRPSASLTIGSNRSRKWSTKRTPLASAYTTGRGLFLSSLAVNMPMLRQCVFATFQSLSISFA